MVLQSSTIPLATIPLADTRTLWSKRTPFVNYPHLFLFYGLSQTSEHVSILHTSAMISPLNLLSTSTIPWMFQKIITSPAHYCQLILHIPLLRPLFFWFGNIKWTHVLSPLIILSTPVQCSSRTLKIIYNKRWSIVIDKVQDFYGHNAG